MADKNAFEIRSEVLQLAKEYMDRQHEMHVEYTQKLIEAGQAQINEVVNAYKPYTFDELMEKSKEFYTFVSSKKDS
jgi:TRAP-type C4-dicarboxylate transport system substrate-binding protein